jgi:hypothetical protein
VDLGGCGRCPGGDLARRQDGGADTGFGDDDSIPAAWGLSPASQPRRLPVGVRAVATITGLPMCSPLLRAEYPARIVTCSNFIARTWDSWGFRMPVAQGFSGENPRGSRNKQDSPSGCQPTVRPGGRINVVGPVLFAVLAVRAVGARRIGAGPELSRPGSWRSGPGSARSAVAPLPGGAAPPCCQNTRLADRDGSEVVQQPVCREFEQLLHLVYGAPSFEDLE